MVAIKFIILKFNLLLLIILFNFFNLNFANAQYQNYAYCKEKVMGQKADPKTGHFIDSSNERKLDTGTVNQISICVTELEKKGQNIPIKSTPSSLSESEIYNICKEKITGNKFFKNPSNAQIAMIAECVTSTNSNQAINEKNKKNNQTEIVNNDTIKQKLTNFDSFVGELSCSSGPTMGPFKKDISGNFKNNISTFNRTTINDNNSNPNNEEYIIKIVGELINLEAIYKFPDRLNNIFLKGNLNSKNLNDNFLKGVMTGSKVGGGILRECEARLKIKSKNLDVAITNLPNREDIAAQDKDSKEKEVEANRRIEIEAKNKAAKETEIERLAALEIEKKRFKEEAEAKAKAAEANRLAAIEADKQKQRDAAEAKARADKAAKETEIERLAALEIEKKRFKEEAEAKAKAAEANRLAAIEADKQKQRDAAEAKARADKAAKEAEIERLAALEIEKQTQKEAVAARVAQMEAEKIRQKELAEAREKIEKEKEVVRLAALEIEKKKAREQLEEKVKSDALRVAALAAENQKQKEEAEARAKAQRLLELENEMKRLMGETTPPKPAVLSRQDPVKNDNDPLSAFEGTWVSVNPPVFYLIFTKVSLGIRQVSLPNLGQGNIRLSDSLHGSNFQISAPNLNCFYFVSFTNNRQKMIMELKAGENLCLQSSILEKAE